MIALNPTVTLKPGEDTVKANAAGQVGGEPSDLQFDQDPSHPRADHQWVKLNKDFY